MFAYPSRTPRRRPPSNGRELHVHAHRDWPGITPDERELVIAFLTRYVGLVRQGAPLRSPAQRGRSARGCRGPLNLSLRQSMWGPSAAPALPDAEIKTAYPKVSR
jgi:hypothetical protein